MDEHAPERIHIVLTRTGLIANDVDLTVIKQLLRRNAPAECELPDSTLLRQTLDLARAGLRNVHAYIARLPDGAEFWFTREVLPPYVSTEALLRSIERSLGRGSAGSLHPASTLDAPCALRE